MSASAMKRLVDPGRDGHLRSAIGSRVLVLFLALSSLTPGCITKAKAKAQAHAAFLAGQQQAAQRAAENQIPTVRIIGEVKNPVLPWTMDLTLTKAILASGYSGKTDPAGIVIMRQGQELRVDPKKLLNGEDFPLQPRDIVELQANAGEQ
jgi:hypothetical protein